MPDEKNEGGLDDDTHDPRLDATLEIESEDEQNRTVSESSERTVSDAELEKTVVVNEERASTPVEPPNAEDVDQTLGASDLESTIQDTTPIGPGESNVSIAMAIDGEQSEMTTGISERETISLLGSKKIGATINPRELSEKDAELWNSITGVSGSRREPSQLAPAIERSLRETNLRINPRTVTKGNLSSAEKSDYRLVRLLGKGGMGNVYVARQGSLDRMIAVKIIRPLAKGKREQLKKAGRLEAVEGDRRQQFLSEAVVTGDLDHPNIVPIHDIAVMGDETLFYAMKRVVGTPWSKVIGEKTRDENLEILLKAADAIGFAHTRGVVHRDIKPENIMLGDFGVVMVMDWGLALPTEDFEKHDSVFPSTGLGGTPAFMAPEMATGPIGRITAASDVYLLGATLFMIITGLPPHHGGSVRECIQAVTANTIREIKDEHRGELMDIAVKALSTDPANRYPNVVSFQQAIRDYRSHAESISLASHAAEDLKKGETSQQYADFSRAIFGFQEALSLWDGNVPAKQGLDQSRLLYAETAFLNEDFDNGLQVLDPSIEHHQPWIDKLQAGIKEREQRIKRLGILRTVAMAMLAVILIGGSASLYVINEKRSQAERAQELAIKQTELANEQTGLANEQTELAEEKTKLARVAEENERQQKVEAVKAKKDAVEQRVIAEQQTRLAKESEQKALDAKREADEAKLAAEISERDALVARDEAETQRKLAEYEVYLSRIGLAKARIERNNFDKARDTLTAIREQRLGVRNARSLPWEYRWLERQVGQSQSFVNTGNAVIQLATSPSADFAISVTEDGSVQRLTLAPDGKILSQSTKSFGDARINTVAISDDGKWVALGTDLGKVQLWDARLQNGKPIIDAHTRGVTSLKFAGGSMLVSGSTDRTVRFWDFHRGTSLADCWHIAPVKQLDIVKLNGSNDWALATAVADASAGRVVLWNVSPNENTLSVTRRGEFDSHAYPVSAVALSTDGRMAVSGDVSGTVMIWRPSTIGEIDYSKQIGDAIKNLERNQTGSRPKRGLTALRLVDGELNAGISDSSINRERANGIESQAGHAHSDAVRAIRFSDDGNTLLTASDDYTVKLWNAQSRDLVSSLRGHGGWVTDADFLAGDAWHVLSCSVDKSVRSWTPKSYVGDASVTQLVNLSSDNGRSLGANEKQAHRDEIWSARFSPDGTRVVTASRDRTARVLRVDRNTMTLEEVGRLQVDDSDVDVENGVLSEGTSFVAMSMAVDQRRGRLYVGSADAVVRIWDLKRGTEIGRMPSTGLNQSIALSADGTLMLTGSSREDSKAMLWKLNPSGLPRPEIVHRLQGNDQDQSHDQAVTAFAISDNGEFLFTGDRDGRGVLWDAKTGKPIGQPFDDLRGYRMNAIRFLPDARSVLVAADDQQLSRIDLATRKRTAKMSHDGFVTSLSLARDGKFALTISESTSENQIKTTATLWEMGTGAGRVIDRSMIARATSGNQAADTNPRGRITSAEIGDRGRLAMISHAGTAGAPSRVGVWKLSDSVETATKQPWIELPRELGSSGSVMPVSQQEFVTLNGDSAFLWNVKSGTHQRSFRAHGAIKQASFSADGKYIATGSRSIKIWNAESMQAVAKLEVAHAGPVRSVEFASGIDGNKPDYRLVTGGDDGFVRVWRFDPKANQVRRIQELNFGGVVEVVRFTRDGKFVLAAGLGGVAKLFRLDSPENAIIFEADSLGDFTCAAISDDGMWIAVGTSQAKGILWNVPQTPTGKVGSPIELNGHAQRIEDIAILQDGDAPMRVFTASEDQTVRVWDPRIQRTTSRSKDAGLTAREVLVLERHTSSVTAVDLAPGGELLLSAGRDAEVMLWPVSRNSP
ncbi:Serine/threonine-protein kinase PknD [Planctomycetes bacterium CA13]|uniref:Serine/threonine-protein kinase PknD n=1 Tax=Novipirellula herctigrandis TaxID=2527986 RepID=A0A5C5ZCH8_9BACT|nr:Serine/threonine-protein kinase PknD [Planctomycetes bacterium CA13]